MDRSLQLQNPGYRTLILAQCGKGRSEGRDESGLQLYNSIYSVEQMM